MPDGRLLLFHRPSHALLARDMQTGAEQTVFDFRAENVDLPEPRYKVAPDGHTVALSAKPHSPAIPENAPTSVIVKVLGGGPSREVVHADPPEYVSFQDWFPDSQAVLFRKFSKGSNGMWPGSLWRVSIHGGDPEPLGLTMDGLRDVRLNPAGTRITFTAGWPINELLVLENSIAR